jgi:polyhydroxyalkanoate synthesis regulator phasin
MNIDPGFLFEQGPAAIAGAVVGMLGTIAAALISRKPLENAIDSRLKILLESYEAQIARYEERIEKYEARIRALEALYNLGD